MGVVEARPQPEYKRLYIMTLGVLKAYRNYGVGRRMLQHVIDLVEKRLNFNEIFLHVQISNSIAIKFYEKFGFKIVRKLHNYYKRIEPPHCYIVSRKFDREKKKLEKNSLESSTEKKKLEKNSSENTSLKPSYNT